MILEKETLYKYGYSVSELTTKQKKVSFVVCSCPVCGKHIDRLYPNAAYREPTCSTECRTEKTKRFNIEKYGVPYISMVKEIKDKKQVKIDSRTTEQKIKIHEKAKRTFIEKYGVDNPQKSEDIRIKTYKTNKIKYGSECVLTNNDIKQQIQNTIKEKYGVDNISKSDNIKKKKADICMRKHGVPCEFSSPNIINKIFETKIEKYGTASTWAISRKNGTVTTEQKIRTLLNDLGCNFIEARIPNSSKHLDMYDESIGIAIEYNGLYWHNELSPNPRDRNYHHNKMVDCMKSNIRLISIFSDEWETREKQVLGFLKATLGKCKNKVFARKTEVREIPDKDAQSFYDEYHIQGRTTKGMKSAGLFYENILVGAMTFGKHHRGKEGIVLTRLCFKDDYAVVGGASKMFKFLCNETNTDSVISWSDNRWSIGGVYESLGFNKDEELGPDYSYVDMNGTSGRISKQSQIKKVTNCPDGMTELEWATERGLARIWDCGKIRWKWTKQNPQS